MSTLESIKSELQEIIADSNATTGGSATTVRDGVDALIGGFGSADLSDIVALLGDGEVVEGSGSGGGDLPIAEQSSFGGEATGGSKFYYNGVLLPEIPQDVLAEYPYCWIRDNSTSGQYDLCFGKGRWYRNSGMYCDDSTSDVEQWYRILKTSYQEATSWDFVQTNTAGFGLDTNRIVMWSNHDIYQVTNSVPKIYFEPTEPVPETENATWYKIKGKTMTDFSGEAQRIGDVETPLTPAQMLEIFKKATIPTTLAKQLYEYCGVGMTTSPYVFMYYKDNILYVAFATSCNENDAYYGKWEGSGTVLHGTFNVGEVSDTSEENMVRLAVRNSKELEQTTGIMFTGVKNSKVYCNYNTKFETEGNNTVYRLDQ